MYSKILIQGDIVVKTGLHIGAFGNDSPPIKKVVKNDNHKPYIPASSLKGKLRNLLTRALKGRLIMQNHADDPIEILRLFGAPHPKGGRGRLTFYDAVLKDPNAYPLIDVKTETSIDRFSGNSEQRRFEIVVPGTRFLFTMIYELDNPEEFGIDMQNMAGALELLSMDYLGGGGTRGNGRIQFENMVVREIYGHQLEEEDLRILNEEVFADAILHL